MIRNQDILLLSLEGKQNKIDGIIKILTKEKRYLCFTINSPYFKNCSPNGSLQKK